MELAGIDHALPDGRPLLHEAAFRVGEGERMALIGPVIGAVDTQMAYAHALVSTDVDRAGVGRCGLGRWP